MTRVSAPAQEIAFRFARCHRLPDWMQTPALGRDMRPLGELAVEALTEAGFAIVPAADLESALACCARSSACGAILRAALPVVVPEEAP